MLKQKPHITVPGTITIDDISFTSDVLIEQHPDVVISLQPYAVKMNSPLLVEINDKNIKGLLERIMVQFPLPVILQVMEFILGETVKADVKAAPERASAAELLINFNPIFAGAGVPDDALFPCNEEEPSGDSLGK